MLLGLAEWCSTKRWSETGKEASISYFELAVEFELHSGLTLTPAGTQRRQENIAQRQPKERWTVADTLPGEETAAFFDGGSRGNGTDGTVAGAGAVFYDNVQPRHGHRTATGGTGLQQLGDCERVGNEDRAEQVGQDCARESRPPGHRDARQPPHQPRGAHPPGPQQTMLKSK
ncbi:hypothetical protein DIPPA_15656 [Diplonema papillatum]|nr:hypothetical protein DIPPA_15656 [Diplonema papillatum]